jgi:transposase
VLGFTIASEIGDISRFTSAKKLVGYTGLCPRVYQSEGKDFRGPLAKNGPKYLLWALNEAATHASRHAVYNDHYDKTKACLGRQRAAKVARVEVARKLAEAIGHMLQTGSHFAPTRSRVSALVA